MPNDEPQSNVDRILYGMLGDTRYVITEPQNLTEKLLITILETGGGGGGGGTAGVIAWNGRNGLVQPRAGDYTAAQVNTSTTGKSVQQSLDELEAALTIDPTLSTTSPRPVRNSAISLKFNEHEGKLVPAGGAAGAVLAKRTGSDHSLEWKGTDEWMLTADYDPDKDGIVNEADLADSVKAGTHKATVTEKGRDLTILTDYDKGAANGVAPLDPSKKILPEYLPDSIMAGLTYGGVFDATTRVVELTPAAKSILDVTADTMTLENSSQIPEGYPANAELFYVTTVGGTFADMTFAVGDWLISLSTSWKQLQNGNQVSSVNAKTGAVVLNSDDVTQGVVNLYMRTTERAKLADIETRATRDVNVIQYATIETDADDNDWLVLTNKNGAVTRFLGGDSDLTDYLEKTGDASQTYATYAPAATRTAFSGNETTSAIRAKIAGWLEALEDVAFTGSYDDLDGKPTYNGTTIEGALTASGLGTLDVREVNALPASPVENTLYVFHTTKRGVPWTRYTIYMDGNWNDIETGGFEVIGIADDPNNTPPTVDAIYVYHWTDGNGVARRQVGIMLDGTYTVVALPEDIITSYDELDDKPEIDGNEIVSGDQTHESLGLVGVDDFVTTESGKAEGIEIVLPAGTPSSPIVLSEINDAEEMRYSTVHTSSNRYINDQIDALNDALAGKLNLLFVEELPEHPTRNTQYYVETETEGTFDIWIVDSVGEMHNAGTTEIDMDGLVRDTRRIAGLRLNADISAVDLVAEIQDVHAVLTGKTLDADENTIANLETDNFAPNIIAESIGATPVHTKIPTEKAVSDFAVKKTTLGPYVYGTASGGAVQNYLVKLSIDVAATSATVPTAKAVYDYSVPKTTGANVVYGTSSTGTAQNLDRVTSISSSSTDAQIPTAKSVYNFAVAKSSAGNRIYGTNSSGGANLYQFSDTYNSTANNQLFTRAGAYNLYSAVRNGEQAMVFCGNFTRNSTQSVGSNTSTRISLTASDIYRTNLVSLASNAIRVLVAGTYWVRFVGRLADTTGATRAWYLGGGNTSSMADDQMGGMWSYTFNRHKAEATYLKYCAANEYVAPWVYIDSNTGTLNYMTCEVFRLNNK